MDINDLAIVRPEVNPLPEGAFRVKGSPETILGAEVPLSFGQSPIGVYFIEEPLLECGAGGRGVFGRIDLGVQRVDRERADPEANITTFGDSVRWAFTTMTTVGYGDHYPVTTLGRWIAVLMMLSGIALIGTVTATQGGTRRRRQW